ncbi:MAG: 50S ribosomal protein L37e [Candidatus Bathyarchaeota archaeon]|nr:MAG: 50S ribosomal protein L37e [Candidatus Bathyarchaeota archaeon]
MGKGTASFGKHGRKLIHFKCRRCGRRAYNPRKKQCAACGYGASPTLKTYAWRTKTLQGERTR